MYNRLFLIVGLFFQSFFLFSSDPNIPTYMIQGVSVQVVERRESEPNAQGEITDCAFVVAEGNDIEQALEIVSNMNLENAICVTAEIDHQNASVYVTTEYPDNCAGVEGFSLK
jgi:hypothetical protein